MRDMVDILKWVSFVSVLLFCGKSFAVEDVAYLLHKAEHVLRGDTTAAIVNIEIKKPEYQRQYVAMLLSDERGDTDSVLVKMIGPALWRGNATLKVKDKLSYYDSRTDRVTVMGNSMLGASWMGSHFTNDDLVRETELSQDYKVRLMEKKSAVNVNGKKVTMYHLNLTPAPMAPVVWARIDYYLYITDDGEVMPHKLDYYRRDDDPAASRTLNYKSVKIMGGRNIPTRLVMTIADGDGEYTSISYEKISFNVKINPNKFTEQAFR